MSLLPETTLLTLITKDGILILDTRSKTLTKLPCQHSKRGTSLAVGSDILALINGSSCLVYDLVGQKHDPARQSVTQYDINATIRNLTDSAVDVVA